MADGAIKTLVTNKGIVLDATKGLVGAVDVTVIGPAILGKSISVRITSYDC